MPPTQSTASTINAKLNQAIQASEADPTALNTLTSTTTSIQQSNSTETFNSPAMTSPSDVTLQQPQSNTATPMTDLSVASMAPVDKSTSRMENSENDTLAAIEKEIDSVVNKPMEDRAPNDLMDTTTATINEIQVNTIDVTGDLGDVMEQQQVETIVTTTLINKEESEHKDAGATQTQATESTIAKLDRFEKASPVSGVIPLDESDEDLDMALPDIDMAGPDTEDDDED